MRWNHQTLLKLLLVPALALTPVLCRADPVGDDVLYQNRLRLEELRKDPAAYARLEKALTEFRKLTTGQEGLRKLDRDLGDQDPVVQARLRRVLERYSDWLEQQPEDVRKRIDSARGEERLQMILDIRLKQWQNRLPRAEREKFEELSKEERAELIHALWKKVQQKDYSAHKDELADLTRIREIQKKEFEDRADWIIAQRNWSSTTRPARLDALPPDVQKFVREKLLPVLSEQQKNRLKEAENRWPTYPRVLVELADSHPIALLGPVYTQIAELDEPVQTEVKRDKRYNKLKAAEGKWPDFAVEVRKVAADLHKSAPKKKPLPNLEEIMALPTQPSNLSAPLRAFLSKKLLPALDDRDQALLEAVKTWPAYPRKVLELARKHNLQVPFEPPGDPDFWDRYRVRPWHKLPGPLE